jgi:hypothetical protein
MTKLKNPNLTLIAMCAFVALLSVKPAFSASKHGMWIPRPASLSCSEYAQAYKANPTSETIEVQMWTLGYMSGVNNAVQSLRNDTGKDLTIITDTTEFTRKLNSYCNKNPNKTLFHFVNETYIELPDFH